MITKCQHPECKKKFEAKRSTRKFCSDACKQAAHRSKGTKKETLKCQYCGEKMTYAGKGRKPKFCRDGHRVQYHKTLRAMLWRAMTKGGCRAFPTYTYNDYRAWELLETDGLEHWKQFIEAYGYEFNGRYFIDTTSQGVLL